MIAPIDRLQMLAFQPKFPFHFHAPRDIAGLASIRPGAAVFTLEPSCDPGSRHLMPPAQHRAGGGYPKLTRVSIKR